MSGSTSGGRPTPGVARPYAFPAVESQRFANGLEALVVPLRRLPLATVLLMSDAGAECDAVAAAGTAQLTTEALAEGTRSRDAVALAGTFEQLGGSLDTGVAWTHATCSTTVLATRLPGALQLLAEVLREPSFPEGEVDRLREEQLAALLQQRAEPRGLADDMFARFCFVAASRYAVGEAGDEAGVAPLTRREVVAHHARYVVPARSRVIVVGDVEVAQVMQLAEETLGAWRRDGEVAPAIDVGAATAGRGLHLVAKDDAPQTELRIGHPSVPRAHRDFHALTVMNAILGGLFNSRINLNLREVHAYTYGAFSQFDWRRYASLFEVSTAVRSDVTGAAVTEIMGEIARMRDERVSDAELSLAVDYLTGVFPIRFETSAAIAGALATRAGFALPANYFDEYRARIAAVTADDVLRVAQLHLDPARLQVVAVGDPLQVRGQLESLALGEVRSYDATGARLEG
ncbi:MAG: insulinase family protein [Gemmatimonadaceae bacterium]|nr:insulinase family protein [Gemmatimonadaceae bacterium]